MALPETHQRHAMNPLVVFDFDDTLVRSDGLIRVIHADGSESVMTTSKFAHYTAQPGDSFDYSMLSGENTVVEVLPHFSVMLDAIALHGASSVFVLTARHNHKPVRKMLSLLNVSRDVRVIATGSTDPQSKVNWMRAKIASGNHDSVRFFDDNRHNVNAMKGLVKEFPGVRLSMVWVRNA